MKSRTGIRKYLINQPNVHVNAQDKNGNTAIHHAAENGNLSIVNILIRREDIKLNTEDQYRLTPLHKATQGGHLQVTKKLLQQRGIKIDARGRYGITPLLEAMVNCPDVAELLLWQHNPDVNAVLELPQSRSTCLHLAVKSGNVDIIRLLLMRNDLNSNVFDYDGWTLLCLAADKGDLRIVQLSLGRKNIRVNSIQPRYPSPIFLVARSNHVGVVQQLLKNPAINPNQLYHNDNALSISAMHGNLEMVDVLLQDGRTHSFSTGLYNAARHEHIAIVDRLLEHPQINRKFLYTKSSDL